MDKKLYTSYYIQWCSILKHRTLNAVIVCIACIHTLTTWVYNTAVIHGSLWRDCSIWYYNYNSYYLSSDTTQLTAGSITRHRCIKKQFEKKIPSTTCTRLPRSPLPSLPPLLKQEPRHPFMQLSISTSSTYTMIAIRKHPKPKLASSIPIPIAVGGRRRRPTESVPSSEEVKETRRVRKVDVIVPGTVCEEEVNPRWRGGGGGGGGGGRRRGGRVVGGGEGGGEPVSEVDGGVVVSGGVELGCGHVTFGVNGVVEFPGCYGLYVRRGLVSKLKWKVWKRGKGEEGGEGGEKIGREKEGLTATDMASEWIPAFASTTLALMKPP